MMDNRAYICVHGLCSSYVIWDKFCYKFLVPYSYINSQSDLCDTRLLYFPLSLYFFDNHNNILKNSKYSNIS